MRTLTTFHLLTSALTLFNCAAAESIFAKYFWPFNWGERQYGCPLRPSELVNITIGPEWDYTQVSTALTNLVRCSRHLHLTKKLSVTLTSEPAIQIFGPAKNGLDQLISDLLYGDIYYDEEVRAHSRHKFAQGAMYGFREHGWREDALRALDLRSHGLSKGGMEKKIVKDHADMEMLDMMMLSVKPWARELRMVIGVRRMSIELQVTLVELIRIMTSLEHLEIKIPREHLRDFRQTFNDPFFPLRLENVKHLGLGAGAEFLIALCPRVESITALDPYMPQEQANNLLHLANSSYATLRSFTMTARWDQKMVHHLTSSMPSLRHLKLHGSIRDDINTMLPTLQTRLPYLEVLELPPIHQIAGSGFTVPSRRSGLRPHLSLSTGRLSRRVATSASLLLTKRNSTSTNLIHQIFSKSNDRADSTTTDIGFNSFRELWLGRTTIAVTDTSTPGDIAISRGERTRALKDELVALLPWYRPSMGDKKKWPSQRRW